MSTAVINGLLEELARRGITLVVDGGQLVARGPAGAMTPELAERVKGHKAALVAALSAYRPAPVAQPSLFDALATAPVAKPVEATAPAATIAPAVAAPVEPTPGLAPADAVTAPAADAQPVELPRGWPSDVPPPDWWAEFTAALDTIWLLSARRQQCGDPACRFLVAVEWAGVEYPPQWACPACGRAADPVAGPPAARPAEAPEAQQPAVEVIEWRYPTAARPGFRVKPKACGWCGPHTEWWQDDKSRWHCVRCNPPARAGGGVTVQQ